MKIEFASAPVFIDPVSDHKNAKENILNAIRKMGKYGIFQPGNVSISNTDWFCQQNLKRPYYEIVNSIFLEKIKKLEEVLELKDIEHSLIINSCWFQQYEKGDFHIWHDHGSFYSAVYYVELPEETSKTTFRFLNREQEFDVKEGDVIIFPGSFLHCSKPNISEKRKTIVSFNITLCSESNKKYYD